MDFWMILTYSAKKQNAESVCKMPPSRQFFKSVVSISGSAKKVGKRTVFSSPFRYAENRTQKRQNRQKSDFIQSLAFYPVKMRFRAADARSVCASPQ